MQRRGVRARAGALLVMAISATTLAACGSNDSSNATTSNSTKATGAATASLAAAKAAIAPYVGKPGPFPVTEPLTKKRPVGAKVAFMDCGTPTCAVLYDITSQAAKAMGVTLYRVKSGSSANTIDAAYGTVAEQKPAAVIDAATDPALFKTALTKLKAAGIPLISTGVIDQDKYGFAGGVFGRPSSENSGKLLADYVYAEHQGDSNSVFYYTPELAFAPILKDAYVTEMKKLCPACTTRSVPLPVASIGNTMPSKIVSDLQSHPDTKTVVTATNEMLAGVPAALKAAGLTVETTGSAGGPDNLQMIKAGQQTSSLYVDLPTMIWMSMDMAARAINKEPIPAAEAKGIPPIQFLTQKDITFDPAKGWAPYPDFAERFKKLWGAAS